MIRAAILVFVSTAIGVPLAAIAQADRGGPKERRTLSCEFDVVQSGQFVGSRYLSSPSKGGLLVTLVSSGADAKIGRAVLIDGERAVIVALVVQPHQTLFVDSSADDVSIVTIFTAARGDADIPAAYSRQSMAGTIAIISQYTGLCRPQ